MSNIFLVGGSIRDKLLKLRSNEFDWVVIEGRIDEFLYDGFKQVGKDFPVFLHPFSKEEYSLARKERKFGKGYYGFVCDFSFHVSLNEDLFRRDITINSLALNKYGVIFNIFNGEIDLLKKRFIHISYSFFEDPLRILRVFRFYIKYYEMNFKFSFYIISFIRKLIFCGEIFFINIERIIKEIFSALYYKNAFFFLILLYDFNILKLIFYDLNLIFLISDKYHFNFYFNFKLHLKNLLFNIFFYSNNLFLKFSLLFTRLGINAYSLNKKNLLMLNRYVNIFNLSKKNKSFLINFFKFKNFFDKLFFLKSLYVFYISYKLNAFKDKVKIFNYLLIMELDFKFNEKIYKFYHKYLILDLFDFFLLKKDLFKLTSNKVLYNCVFKKVLFSFYKFYNKNTF